MPSSKAATLVRYKEPLEIRWRNLRIKDFGDPSTKPPGDAIVLLGKDGGLSAWEHVDKPSSKVEWTW